LSEFRFEAEIIYWRGPAPFFYAPVPAAEAAQIRAAAKMVSYGWGVIPVEVTVGDVVFKTSLFPKDGTYLVPLKDEVRRKTGVTAGDRIAIEMVLKPKWG
jgi:hypothetical protein